jgi:myo-inositol 2-dehydrogenase/D-chiro-inositol 1-dehydrogenase
MLMFISPSEILLGTPYAASAGTHQEIAMRVAIIGAGSMGHTHAAGWSSTDAQLVGIVATHQASAETLAQQYGARVYDSLEAVLPDVDIVDICTPTHLHLEFTLKAAAAGKQIICEKPIARTLADGQKMIAACHEAGVRLFVGMTVRFFPQYRSAYESLQQGKIGNPAVIRLTRATYRPHKVVDDWFADFSKSGGPLLDMLIHDYDVARWYAGEVERVYAKASPPDEGGISNYAQVLLRFRTGAIGHVEGGWAYPPPLFRTKLEVAGETGLIEWESDNSAPLNIYLKAQPGQTADVGLPLSPLNEDPYTTMIKSYYDALIHNKNFSVTPHDALAALQIALAAIESVHSGQPVTLSPLTEVF